VAGETGEVVLKELSSVSDGYEAVRSRPGDQNRGRRSLILPNIKDLIRKMDGLYPWEICACGVDMSVLVSAKDYTLFRRPRLFPQAITLATIGFHFCQVTEFHIG
jgi:hypothetical protein